MRAMVLAAGLGTRLRPITYDDAEADGAGAQPAGDGAHRCGSSPGTASSETIANLHWFPELIEGYFGDGSASGWRSTYSREEAAARHRRRGAQRRATSSATIAS